MNLTEADKIYIGLIRKLGKGDVIETRNSKTISSINLPTMTFTTFPLVTVRKTAWRLALMEMAWFISGDIKCPSELSHWWKGQLNGNGEYLNGYSQQFRGSTSYINDDLIFFDQIKFLIKEIKEHPNSRRLILSSWNSGEMSCIREINDNSNTPSTCHNSLTQFFVRDNKLHLKTYQRSMI